MFRAVRSLATRKRIALGGALLLAATGTYVMTQTRYRCLAFAHCWNKPFARIVRGETYLDEKEWVYGTKGDFLLIDGAREKDHAATDRLLRNFKYYTDNRHTLPSWCQRWLPEIFPAWDEAIEKARLYDNAIFLKSLIDGGFVTSFASSPKSVHVRPTVFHGNDPMQVWADNGGKVGIYCAMEVLDVDTIRVGLAKPHLWNQLHAYNKWISIGHSWPILATDKAVVESVTATMTPEAVKTLLQYHDKNTDWFPMTEHAVKRGRVSPSELVEMLPDVLDSRVERGMPADLLVWLRKLGISDTAIRNATNKDGRTTIFMAEEAVEFARLMKGDKDVGKWAKRHAQALTFQSHLTGSPKDASQPARDAHGRDSHEAARIRFNWVMRDDDSVGMSGWGGGMGCGGFSFGPSFCPLLR